MFTVPVAEASVQTLIKSIDKVIINPIILFLFAVAIVYFLYGLAQYLLSPDNEEVRKSSKSHMMWGVIGLFIMVAVFGIMKIILNTFGETKIRVSSNGDYTVTGNNVSDQSVKEDAKSGQDLFNGSLDVSSDVNAPDLPQSTFTTSPFAKYKQSSLCWNGINGAIGPIKASTEFDAMSKLKTEARAQYVKDLGSKASDVSKKDALGNDIYNYPVAFETKVLYNKNTKIYYAWGDFRAPTQTSGTMSDCKLEMITPAPVIPQSAITSGENNLSTTVYKTETNNYTVSPFLEQYVPSAMCWRDEMVSDPLSTEYKALQQLKAKARKAYLAATGLVDGSVPDSLPAPYRTVTYYDKVNKSYYVWWDVRGSVKGKNGNEIDCHLDEVLEPVNESSKANPLQLYYTSDAYYYRAIGSGTDTTYVGARGAAIHNALIDIARQKGITNTSTLIYSVLPEEKYYAQDRVTGKYDYWLVVESKR